VATADVPAFAAVVATAAVPALDAVLATFVTEDNTVVVLFSKSAISFLNFKIAISSSNLPDAVKCKTQPC